MGSGNRYCCCQLNVGVIVASSVTLALQLISIILTGIGALNFASKWATISIGIIVMIACILAIVGAAKEIWGLVLPYCITLAIYCLYMLISIIIVAVALFGVRDNNAVTLLGGTVSILIILLALALWALISASAYVHETRTRSSGQRNIA